MGTDYKVYEFSSENNTALNVSDTNGTNVSPECYLKKEKQKKKQKKTGYFYNKTISHSEIVFFSLMPKNVVCLDLKNPEIVTLRNLSRESAGVYKCTASNDVGEESCTVEVKIHCK